MAARNNSQLSLPQLKSEMGLTGSDKGSRQGMTQHKKNTSIPNPEEVRAAFKAGPEPVYLQGDEEFLKQNLVADHFPNRTNPYECELNE